MAACDRNGKSSLSPLFPAKRHDAKNLERLERLELLLNRWARGIALLLERRFELEKAAPKLLTRADSALFFS